MRLLLFPYLFIGFSYWILHSPPSDILSVGFYQVLLNSNTCILTDSTIAYYGIKYLLLECVGVCVWILPQKEGPSKTRGKYNYSYIYST